MKLAFRTIQICSVAEEPAYGKRTHETRNQ